MNYIKYLIIFSSLLFSTLLISAEMPSPKHWTLNAYNQPVVVATNNNFALLILSNSNIELHRVNLSCDSTDKASPIQVVLTVNDKAVQFMTYCLDKHRVFWPRNEDGLTFIFALLMTANTIKISDLNFTTNNFINTANKWKKLNESAL